jgi:hypothetical protein
MIMRVEQTLGWARGMMPVLGIAVAVVVMGTLTGYAWDRVHQATADESISKGVQAKAGPNGTQILQISEWGVTATFPLASEFPLLSYAVQPGGNTVGLSSVDLAKVGPACRPGGNALGTLVRYPTGSYGTSVQAMAGSNVISTVGSYDYIYAFPQNTCADHTEAMTIINRETPVVLEGLGSLVASQP